MTISQSKYLDILRAALWDRPYDGKITEDVLLIARQQSTIGLICSKSQDRTFHKGVLKTVYSNDKLNSALREFSDILKGNDVDFVLLKGQGCASYYPDPYLRNCGDIDIYVRKPDYERTCRIAGEAADRDKPVEEEEKHFQISFHGIKIEIHKASEIFPSQETDRLFREYEEDGLTRNLVPVRIEDFTVNTPEDTFNAMYIFVHFFNHFVWLGVGLRQICDWTMLLHRRGGYVDREKLGDRLESLGLMKEWKAFGALAVDCLGLPPEEMPFYDSSYVKMAWKVLSRLFATGNFGRNKIHIRFRKAGYPVRKISSVIRHTGNNIAIFRLFPKQSALSYAGRFSRNVRRIFLSVPFRPARRAVGENIP